MPSKNTETPISPLDPGDRQSVRTGSTRPGVTRDPLERHDQRRRVVHKVEQVVEPAARIGRSPTVKFGLYPRYPPERILTDVLRWGVAVRRRVFRHDSVLSFSELLPSFPMWSALPTSEYYDGSAPPDPFGRRCAYPNRWTG